MIPATPHSIQVGSLQEPRTSPKACIFWMHGLGAESMDMEMLVHNLPLSDLPLRHIFLNAPIRPVSLNGGIEMRAWYDIPPNFSPLNEDKAGILSATQGIYSLIEQQINDGIPSKFIGLAGFSQGGAMALHAGLHYSQPLAGIAALSGYLPLSQTHNKMLPKVQKTTPFFIGAGLQDTVVHYEWTKATHLHLESMGYQHVDFHAYPMEHCVCMDEMRNLAAWIRKCFSF